MKLKTVIIILQKRKFFNYLINTHSSEKEDLRSTKMSGQTLQNFLGLCKTKWKLAIFALQIFFKEGKVEFIVPGKVTLHY